MVRQIRDRSEVSHSNPSAAPQPADVRRRHALAYIAARTATPPGTLGTPCLDIGQRQHRHVPHPRRMNELPRRQSSPRMFRAKVVLL